LVSSATDVFRIVFYLTAAFASAVVQDEKPDGADCGPSASAGSDDAVVDVVTLKSNIRRPSASSDDLLCKSNPIQFNRRVTIDFSGTPGAIPSNSLASD
jgi:hypothetical protein